MPSPVCKPWVQVAVAEIEVWAINHIQNYGWYVHAIMYNSHSLSALVESSEHVGSLSLVVEVLIFKWHILDGIFVLDTAL